MKHLGYDMRIDNDGDIRLRHCRSGYKSYIFIWPGDDYTVYPHSVPRRVVEWALCKRAQLEGQLERREARRLNPNAERYIRAECYADWRKEWTAWER